MFVTIINDCYDANAFGRQATRASVLFGTSINTVGVDFGATIQGAGNLIDMLDAAEGQEGVILVNLAPRHGEGKRWKNGTPFGYFFYKKTLVVTSVAGYTLSLIKKLGLAKEIYVMDIPTVIAFVEKKKLITKEVGEHIIHTQFRSYDFVPRAAKWIWDGIKIPAEKGSIQDIADAPKAVWWIDNFGNCKTTIFSDEIAHTPGETLKTKFGTVQCYERLKDVPNGEPGFIVGSSGFGEKRFLELVIQGGNASKHFGIKTGDSIV